MMRNLAWIAAVITAAPMLTSAATLNVLPEQPLQGEAVLVRSDLPYGQIVSITLDGRPLPYFQSGTTTAALIGVANSARIGTSTVVITAKSGLVLSADYVVTSRIHPTEALAIPAQLGGNSTSNQVKFVSTLDKENALLAAIPVSKKTLWAKPFIAPVPNPIITNPYGYIRDSNAATIIHKGADFKAPIGTSVAAMNKGKVVMSRYSPVYGNAIDHGQGVLTMYMHLSKRLAAKGSTVIRGQKIGLSGDTGYSEGAHLHITARINGESIDPVEFLGLFGVSTATN